MRLYTEAELSGTDVLALSQALLGDVIVNEIDGGYCSARIVETEAYRAPDDKGSHAYGNKVTKRTAGMYEAPGRAYVYLCYGIHHLFNVITAPEGMAHVVLIRAVEPIEGIDLMLHRRSMDSPTPNLTNGPGKWTQAMGITRDYDGSSLVRQDGSIRLYHDQEVSPGDIIASERVGIAYAEECAHWPWRYRIKDHRWTSKPDVVKY